MANITELECLEILKAGRLAELVSSVGGLLLRSG